MTMPSVKVPLRWCCFRTIFTRAPDLIWSLCWLGCIFIYRNFAAYSAFARVFYFLTKTHIGKNANLVCVVGEGNLSDLARSCEYLTLEKSCLAVSESEKAKASRQMRCQNEEKMTCCYLCVSRRECVISCRFLGNMENQVSSAQAENTFNHDKTTEEPHTKNAPAICCSLCNVEMSQARTKLRIDGWEGPRSNDGALGEEFPVRVYLCPQCGKIEFKADKEHQNKE